MIRIDSVAEEKEVALFAKEETWMQWWLVPVQY